jgi:hypothetical protein
VLLVVDDFPGVLNDRENYIFADKVNCSQNEDETKTSPVP